MSLFSTHIVCTGNYSVFLLHLLLPSHLIIIFLLNKTNTLSLPFLYLHQFVPFVLCMLHYTHTALGQCTRANALLLSVLSVLTSSPNATLLFPLDEVFSSDHGPFLLSFPPSIHSTPSFVTSISCASLSLCLLQTITNLFFFLNKMCFFPSSQLRFIIAIKFKFII